MRVSSGKKFANSASLRVTRWSGIWLREYLGRPGRSSTEEEKAKHQSFMEKVAAEPGLVLVNPQPAQEIKEPVSGEEAVDPLGSPRHLTLWLLRKPESLNAQERSTLTFIREMPDINTT